MKISERLSQYALVGGFYWIIQLYLIISVRLDSKETVWLQYIQPLLKRIPQQAMPSLAALFGAFALIIIFVTGLLLELVGTYVFRSTETNRFVGYLQRNKSWVKPLLDQYDGYVQHDFAMLSDWTPGYSKRSFTALLRALRFWNAKFREEYSCILGNRWKSVKAYDRTQSFLLSYVFLGCDQVKIDLLNVQISLWSISRAIAAAMLFAYFQIYFILRFHLWNLTSGFVVFGLGVPFVALGVIAIVVAVGAHARVSNTLFALAYLVSKGHCPPKAAQA